MKAKIVVQAPGGASHEYPLTERVTTIGRSEACDLTLDYSYVSREHARLEFADGGYAVTDLKSTNGTHVNGRRIGETQLLTSGDEIRIGDVTMTFVDALAEGIEPTIFRPIPAECPIRCDSSAWQVWVGDRQIDTRFSLQEFELLSLLTSRYGRLCTREELGTAIWGRGNYDLNMLHRLVHRLKQKLGEELEGAVVSVPGKGYKMEVPA